jgi:hypothetical protein
MVQNAPGETLDNSKTIVPCNASTISMILFAPSRPEGE